MIKAIIFDAGGVIVDSKKLINKFIKLFKPKNSANFWEEINIKVIPLCAGQKTEEECSKEIAESIGMDPNEAPKHPWTKDYEKLTKLDKKMLNLIGKLKKNYKTALISNTIKSHANIDKKRGLHDPFDVITLSYKVGITKEKKDIFLITIKNLGVKAEECIFIDDIKQFVDTAKSIGMKTIHFKNLKQLKDSLRKLQITL